MRIGPAIRKSCTMRVNTLWPVSLSITIFTRIWLCLSGSPSVIFVRIEGLNAERQAELISE
jgi:hypothetical protein